jgi:hypothetical protein
VLEERERKYSVKCGVNKNIDLWKMNDLNECKSNKKYKGKKKNENLIF